MLTIRFVNVDAEMKKIPLILAVVVIVGTTACIPVEAAGVSRTLTKAAMQRVLARDMAIHTRVPVRPLARDTRVWRYTTLTQARAESRRGIAPGSHMTAHTTPGRLPSGSVAQARYGLIKEPTARVTVHLTRGFPVRRNKAVMASPGIGEVTSNVRVPRQAIVKIQSLPK